MPWFVKYETFTAVAAAMPIEQRRTIIQAHRQWVQQEKAKGRLIHSGFLVDEKRNPGAGGLMVFSANNYEEAFQWVQYDPMICQGLVIWLLSEWIIDCEKSFDRGDESVN